MFSKLDGSGHSQSRWDPIVWPAWESLIPPRELWVGPDDPVVHFFRWAWEYRAYLVLLCDLREDASVLELGCNHGRTMLGLLDYLRPPGKYEGLDIMSLQVEFAQRNIHSKFPAFNFTHADIHNAVYNPQGRFRAELFKFPYPDSCFDVIYAASLFTHLLPPSAANYFRETKRVLKKGGKCLFSFFILNCYRGKGTTRWTGYEFGYPVANFGGVSIHNPALPEQLVGYEAGFLENMAAEAGLKVKRIVPGYWSKSSVLSVNEQDLVLIEAA